MVSAARERGVEGGRGGRVRFEVARDEASSAREEVEEGDELWLSSFEVGAGWNEVETDRGQQRAFLLLQRPSNWTDLVDSVLQLGCEIDSGDVLESGLVGFGIVDVLLLRRRDHGVDRSLLGLVIFLRLSDEGCLTTAD